MITSFSNNRNELNISIINLISLLFIFRSSIPAFKYPFLLFYMFFLIYLFVSNKSSVFNSTKIFFRYYYLVILLFAIFVLPTFLSNKIYLINFKDILNVLILLSLLFFYSITINTKEKLKFGINNLVKWIIFLSICMALYWIFDFLSIYLPHSSNVRNYENSLVDRNFAIVPTLLAAVSILFSLARKLSKSQNYILNIILITLYLQLFLSASRRGFIISNLILIVIFSIYFSSLCFKNANIKAFAKSIRPFVFTMLISFGLIYIFISHVSSESKLNFLNSLNLKNSLTFQNEISRKFFRYKKIFVPNQSFYDFHKRIWSPSFDPYNPDSGWGTRIHKTIHPLTGTNVDIVPEGAKGYLMNNTCNADSWDDNAYSYTEIDFSSNLIKKNDTIEVSVFCYVSDEFNGDWACIIINNWIGSTYYNMKKKGTWQKLSITQKVTSNQVLSSLYFAKTGVKNFSNLKGHVIFAYPKIKIIGNRDSISQNLIKAPISLKKIEQSKVYKATFSYGIFKKMKRLSKKEVDPIREFVKKLLDEDTTYHPYKAKLNIDYSKSIGDDRLSRWKFALEIFTKEYNWKQKIFGGGFKFLNWYGYAFLKDKTKTDYPHNPFLYILLYSGITGVLLYILLLYNVIKYYWKYRKEYPLLPIFFLITYFFTFFSGGNPFDPPVMGFFMMLPFLIHSVHKREEQNKAIEK